MVAVRMRSTRKLRSWIIEQVSLLQVGWGGGIKCPVNTVYVDALKPSDKVQGKINTSTWILMSINLVDY